MVTVFTPFPVITFIGRLFLTLTVVCLASLVGVLSMDALGCALQYGLPTEGLVCEELLEEALLFVGAPLCTFINFPRLICWPREAVIEGLPLPLRKTIVVLRGPLRLVRDQLLHLRRLTMFGCSPELSC